MTRFLLCYPNYQGRSLRRDAGSHERCMVHLYTQSGKESGEVDRAAEDIENSGARCYIKAYRGGKVAIAYGGESPILAVNIDDSAGDEAGRGWSSDIHKIPAFGLYYYIICRGG